jgi:hypothetical protein
VPSADYSSAYKLPRADGSLFSLVPQVLKAVPADSAARRHTGVKYLQSPFEQQIPPREFVDITVTTVL